MPVSPIQITIRDYLRIVGQRKIWIILCLVVSVFAFFGYGKFVMKPVYQASNSIEVVPPSTQQSQLLSGISTAATVKTRLEKIISRIHHKSNKEELMAMLVAEYWVGKDYSLKALVENLNRLRAEKKPENAPTAEVQRATAEAIAKLIENKNLISLRSPKGIIEENILTFVASDKPLPENIEQEIERFFSDYALAYEVRTNLKTLENLYVWSELEIKDEYMKKDVTAAQKNLRDSVLKITPEDAEERTAKDLLVAFAGGRSDMMPEDVFKMDSLIRKRLLFLSSDQVYERMSSILANLTIELSGDYINIAFEWDNPYFARDMADVIIKILKIKNEQFQQEEVSTPIKFLQRQVKEQRRALFEARALIKQYKDKHPTEVAGKVLDETQKLVKDIPEFSIYEAYFKTKDEIAALQSDIEKLDGQITEFEAYLKNIPQRVEQVKTYSEERLLLDRKIGEKKEELSKMSDYSPRHPEYIRIARELDVLQKQRDAIAPMQVSQERTVESAALEKTKMDLQGMKGERKGKQRQLDILASRLQEQQENIRHQVGVTEEYEELLQEHARLDKLYTEFNNRLESAYLTQQVENAEGTQFKVVHETRVPQIPAKPNLMVLALMGFLVGLFASGSIVLLLEFADHSIRDIDDARRHLDILVLGTVSDFSFQKHEAGRMMSRSHISWLIILLITLAAVFVLFNFQRIEEFFKKPPVNYMSIKEADGAGDKNGVPAATGTINSAAPSSTAAAAPVDTTPVKPEGPVPSMSEPAPAKKTSDAVIIKRVEKTPGSEEQPKETKP
jgi:capsular polysaccharide biosynthesis protein